MTTDSERGNRRRAGRVRIRRQRLATAAAGLGLVAGGVVAAVLFGTGGGGGGKVSAPTTTPVGYSGSKLRPQPTLGRRPRPRPGGLPTAAEQRRAVERVARFGLPLLCGGGRGKYVALTFDDGPGPYTELAMRILRKRHLRATWFLVGSRVELYPSLPKREAMLGALGDHTWSHPYLPSLSTARIREELVSTLALLRRTSSAPVLLFRPPYGGRDARVDRIARSLGLLEVLWSIDSGDSTGSDVRGVYRNVIRALEPGSIVLMHENRATTIKSLIHFVLPAIRKRGFKLVSVPELLALDPPSASQVRKRRC